MASLKERIDKLTQTNDKIDNTNYSIYTLTFDIPNDRLSETMLVENKHMLLGISFDVIKHLPHKHVITIINGNEVIVVLYGNDEFKFMWQASSFLVSMYKQYETLQSNELTYQFKCKSFKTSTLDDIYAYLLNRELNYNNKLQKLTKEVGVKTNSAIIFNDKTYGLVFEEIKQLERDVESRKGFYEYFNFPTKIEEDDR